jgi:hypothetical protein
MLDQVSLMSFCFHRRLCTSVRAPLTFVIDKHMAIKSFMEIIDQLWFLEVDVCSRMHQPSMAAEKNELLQFTQPQLPP